MQKQATQLFALLAALLVIWFVIPMIAVNGHPLLPTTTTRLISICCVSIIWLIILLLHSPGEASGSEKEKPSKKTFTFSPQNFLITALKKFKYKYSAKKKKAQSKQKTEGIYAEANLILTQHFQSVREYLRTHTKNLKRPAYLIVGHKGSGKSALLKHSGLKLKSIPAVEQKNNLSDCFEYVPGTDNHPDCKDTIWQLEQQCIFIDTPGDYAGSEIDGKTQTPWRTLLNLLVRKYKKHPLKAIIVTINIHELLSDTQQKTRLHLHLLKQRVQEVKKFYGETLPLYLVFTHWDVVTGFSEFFDNLNTNERKESFAIRFHKKFTNQSVTSQFQAQYEILLQTMNRMLITRMHHEHNHKKRALISQFPLQMEQLQKHFFHVVQQLLEKMSDIDAVAPKAVFFTSSELSSKSVDIIQKKLQGSFNLPSTECSLLKSSYSKSHFIENIFKELLQNNESHSSGLQTGLQLNTYGKYAIYGTASVIILAFGSLCIFKFISSVVNINQIGQSTYALKLLQDKTHNPKAAADTANILTAQMDQTSKFWLSSQQPVYKNLAAVTAANTTVHTQATDAASTLTKTKTSVTQPKVAPKLQINMQLQNYLQQRLTAARAQPADLYGTLKAYLMLANPNYLQTSWLYNWLKKNVVSNNILSAKVVTLIIKALQQQYIIVSPNENIVAQARKQLTTLPKQYLTLLILQDQAQYSNANALSIKFINKSYTIPFLFTAKGLQTLFLNNLHSAINEAGGNNWILGPMNSNEPSGAENTIEAQVVNLYITNYVNWWTHVLSSFQVPEFTSLKNLADYAAQLNNSNSGLIDNLSTISNNINAVLILPNSVSNPEIELIRNALQQQVNSKFGNIANIDLDNLQVALMQYNQMLYNFTQSPDNKAAFETIKSLFKNPEQPSALTGFISFAGKQPEPVRTELLSLAKQTMPMVQKAAGSYVETEWQTRVFGFFENNLQHTYPLYPKAAKDASLKDFIKFFAPGGILDSFYRNTLTPFIDTSKADWTLKSANGLTLPLSGQLLRTLEKGRIIRAMFFPHNSNKMKVQFTLQQIALMPIVKSFTLNINGQNLNDQQGSRNISTFVWPGNSGNTDTQMNFNDINGQHTSSQQGGPWAWFHLLDQSFIHSDDNSQSYVVTFDVDGNEARYHLNASDPINPFIPGIISSFRLPAKITVT